MVVKLVKDFSLCRGNIGDSSCCLGEFAGLESPTLHSRNYSVPRQWVSTSETIPITQNLNMQKLASIFTQLFRAKERPISRGEYILMIRTHARTNLIDFTTNRRVGSYNSLTPVVGVHGSVGADSSGCKCSVNISYNS